MPHNPTFLNLSVLEDTSSITLFNFSPPYSSQSRLSPTLVISTTTSVGGSIIVKRTFDYKAHTFPLILSSESAF